MLFHRIKSLILIKEYNIIQHYFPTLWPSGRRPHDGVTRAERSVFFQTVLFVAKYLIFTIHVKHNINCKVPLKVFDFKLRKYRSVQNR